MDDGLFRLPPVAVAPGAVHLPGHLDPAAQRELLAACRRWARPPAGLRTVRMPGGGEMSARQVGLGWHWYPYGYSRTAVDGDGSPVKPFPDWLGKWARRVLEEAYGRAPSGAHGATPYDLPYDLALVNFYDDRARMGMHRDRDEESDAPVVSFSLGDTCVFRFGNAGGRGRPWTDVELRSGDAFVFGGPARWAYHGVPRTRSGTAPPALGLRGRVSVTVRQR
ncbi:alpha-ketoglutarate-dependent dioxygenase AlkB [Streptomyces sp. TRM 70361]|uniref:alpha-ketoglutarate-dependent dioxygenase AlkB family protein n=1 Tax=Streptomyces sp. TRM 70361 TaxID=3116553 RepID=UPI002E7AF30D|nr:alpha-ketoglutarate-dependent dioxygenase AlkB [Streptomyces sp. TRM 70361]MEE1942125.1 alpha-ketoglutarate-dependent dioxygenase AlkB [Streptomyces sp. TRM 70361]